MSDIEDGVIGLFIVMAFVFGPSFYESSFFRSGDTTVYMALKDDNGRWQPSIRFVYHADVANQTVTYWDKENISELGKLDGCSVRDSNNWRCGSFVMQGGSIGLKKSDGEWYRDDPIVTGWTWWRLRIRRFFWEFKWKIDKPEGPPAPLTLSDLQNK